MNPYLKQKAAPWVSFAVLAGGIATTFILVMLYRVQVRVDTFDDNISSYLEESQPTTSRASQQG